MKSRGDEGRQQKRRGEEETFNRSLNSQAGQSSSYGEETKLMMDKVVLNRAGQGKVPGTKPV